MIKIDEATGLAALPYDKIWRVSDDKFDHRKDVGALKIQLINITETTSPGEETVVTDKVPNGFWTRLFTGREYSKVKRVVPATDIVHTNEYVQETFSLLKESDVLPPEDTGEWRKMVFNNRWSGEQETVYFQVTPATPEVLRDASVKLWETYLTKRHELALAYDLRRDLERFMGDYPPKKLVDA